MNKFAITEEDFISFKDLVYKESGICFNVVNKVVLESRIEISMKENEILSIKDFYSFISEDKINLYKFLDKITTNLTKFFRTESHFEVLKDILLPKLLKDRLNFKIKIWSAGCSTGEEAYSIAITCLETFGMAEQNFHVFASDLSLKSLIKARDGRYSKDKVDNVPLDYLSKYFDKTDDGSYLVKSFVRKLITFDFHNLIHIGTQRNMDIIFCKNVLIYFDSESQKLTVNRFYDILNRGGYLFIGHSESLFGMDTNFNFNNINGAIVYSKN